nr:MAG TPA: hypothetical protein [Caudoviricetes sp.]
MIRGIPKPAVLHYGYNSVYTPIMRFVASL